MNILPPTTSRRHRRKRVAVPPKCDSDPILSRWQEKGQQPSIAAVRVIIGDSGLALRPRRLVVKVVASSGSERGEHLFRFASVAADRLVVAAAGG